MQEKCMIDPERDCLGVQRAAEAAGDVKALDKKLDEFRRGVSETHERFGARIGQLEARGAVREEQYQHLKEKLENLTGDMEDFQKENKNSIAELRKEHKESMDELRKGNKEILDAVTPLKHKVDELGHLEADVDKLKEKPAKTWESIKSQVLVFAVGIVLVLIAIALGLGGYIGKG